MAINILEKAVHALKKAVKELEGQAGNATKIRDVARELEPALEPVKDVVFKMEGELECVSLGRIPDMLRDLAEAPDEEFNKFLHAIRGDWK